MVARESALRRDVLHRRVRVPQQPERMPHPQPLQELLRPFSHIAKEQFPKLHREIGGAKFSLHTLQCAADALIAFRQILARERMLAQLARKEALH